MIKLSYYILTYLVFELFISLPLEILGWFLIVPLALLNKYTTKKDISIVNGREILNWKYNFMYIWSNDEDGIAGGDNYLDKPLWFRIIYWSALRNSTNNLRYVRYLSCNINPEKINYILSDIKDINDNLVASPQLRDYDRDDLRFTSLVWQGIYSNYRIQFKMSGSIYRFWIGWKLYPADSLGISQADYRYKGAGFAIQFKKIYPK